MTQTENYDVSLILVRHGQSEHNAKNIHAGWVDSPLTTKGIKQALEAGQLLKNETVKFNCVFASDLQRSYITAEKILEALGLQKLAICKDANIKERHCGDYEDVERDTNRLFLKNPEIRPEGIGGESFNDLCEGRINTFVHKTLLPLIKLKQNTLIVAHNQSIRAIIKVLLDDLNIEKLNQIYENDIPNTSPCILKFKNIADLNQVSIETICNK